jgi:hypothetical protein
VRGPKRSARRQQQREAAVFVPIGASIFFATTYTEIGATWINEKQNETVMRGSEREGRVTWGRFRRPRASGWRLGLGSLECGGARMGAGLLWG